MTGNKGGRHITQVPCQICTEQLELGVLGGRKENYHLNLQLKSACWSLTHSLSRLCMHLYAEAQ